MEKIEKVIMGCKDFPVYLDHIADKVNELVDAVTRLERNLYADKQPEPKKCHPENLPQENVFGKTRCDKCGNFYEPKKTLAKSLMT